MKEKYYEKIYGCFLGKSVGGSIGGPFEGRKEFIDLPYKMPDEILANDDLDLQIVWLDLLRKKGVKIDSKDIAKAWENIEYPFDEYGVAKFNLKLGLTPPITGIYNNWFSECMGAPIRSEIWACVFPKKPEIAGYYAYLDSSVDHWNEGVYGEIFLAVIESIAFEEKNIEKLIEKGCEYLPEESNVRRVSQMVLELYRKGKDLREVREEIIEKFGHYNFTHCVQNIGFIICGLLYGNGDFLKTMIEAVKCGYDTDCTGATSGAIIGIILGKEEIEKQAKTKIDKRIVAGWGIKNVYVPEDIDRLTEIIMEVMEKAENEKNLNEIEKPFKLPSIGEFTPPLKFEFRISDVFDFDEVGDIEKEIVGDKCNRFRKFVFDSFFIPVEKFFNGKKGVLFLKTEIEFEEKRKIKICPVSTDGIKLWVNKNLVLSHHNHNPEFIPTPVRPSSPGVVVDIEKEKNEVLIEVIKCNDNINFSFMISDERNHFFPFKSNFYK